MESHDDNQKEHQKETPQEPPQESPQETQREETAVEEGAEQGTPEAVIEEKETPKEKGADRKPSEGPTDKQITRWTADNPFECEIKGCNHGMGGRPYRCKRFGALNLHKYNSHGIKSKKTKEEGKAGEVDMAEDVEKRIDKVTLRGKITKAIGRISKLPKDRRADLEVERTLMMDWKTRTFTTEVPVEELQRYESEFLSSIIPAIEEMEEEIKEEKAGKKTKAEKKSKRERDDDFDPMDDLNDQMRFSMMQERIEAMEDRREERENRRRRRDEREDELHKANMEATKRGGGGAITSFGGPGQGGYVYSEEVTFRHDEEGNLIVKDGKPVPQSLIKTPIHPMMLMQPPVSKSGGGGEANPLFKIMKETADANREEAKDSRATTDNLIKALTEEKEKSRDKEIQGQFNNITGAINTMAEQMKKDPITEYLGMENKLKAKGIFRGGANPESKKVDLQIEQEITHRDLMKLEFTEGIRLVDSMAGKLMDGHLAKAMARKIEEGLPAGQEEEEPDDAVLEAEMEKEVGKPGDKKKRKRAGEN